MGNMSRKRTAMTTAKAKQFVISFRVTAEEWRALKRETELSGTSVSRLLRSNLHLLFRADQDSVEAFGELEQEFS